jgi:hypothetical protein
VKPSDEQTEAALMGADAGAVPAERALASDLRDRVRRPHDVFDFFRFRHARGATALEEAVTGDFMPTLRNRLHGFRIALGDAAADNESHRRLTRPHSSRGLDKFCYPLGSD